MVGRGVRIFDALFSRYLIRLTRLYEDDFVCAVGHIIICKRLATELAGVDLVSQAYALACGVKRRIPSFDRVVIS